MRRKIKILIVSISLILCSCVTCSAKEWRGIRPLYTTRSEVIKFLGKPTHLLWDYRDFFILDNEVVTFEWIDPTCERMYPVSPDSAVRSEDLVLSISVRMKKPLSREQLGIPWGNFSFLDCLGSGCLNMESGDFSFYETKDGVTDLTYGATTQESKAWFEGHKDCSEPRND